MTEFNTNMLNQTDKGAEILCIGTELLLGNILNGNAKWLAEELAFFGIPHYRQVVVGDNKKRLIEAFLEASNRSRFLITTGGLGPTQDDITVESLAEAFESELTEDETSWELIKAKLDSKNLSSPTIERKQALVPAGAEVIHNKSGTAPGIIWTPQSNFTIITLPGVPSEMRDMWKDSAAKLLYSNIQKKEVISSKILRFSGISESTIAKKVSDLIQLDNPTVAPYASLGDVKLRITARSSSKEDSHQLIDPIIEEIESRIGSFCYGKDEDSLASVTLALLNKRSETIAVAESCTGGQLSSALTSIPGASKTFIGGSIVYANEAKETLLGVPKKLIEEFGAVSKEVVIAMAKGIKKNLQSDWAIAISGVAGPDGGTDKKPVGSVYLGIIGPQDCEAILEDFGKYRSRQAIQTLSVISSLDRLRILLLSRS